MLTDEKSKFTGKNDLVASKNMQPADELNPRAKEEITREHKVSKVDGKKNQQHG